MFELAVLFLFLLLLTSLFISETFCSSCCLRACSSAWRFVPLVVYEFVHQQDVFVLLVVYELVHQPGVFVPLVVYEFVHQQDVLFFLLFTSLFISLAFFILLLTSLFLGLTLLIFLLLSFFVSFFLVLLSLSFCSVVLEATFY